MLDLTNRDNCFYWQTDRDLSASDYEKFFLKRQDSPVEELVTILKHGITTIPTETLEIFPKDENVTKGNVNIVRRIFINGKQYIVRMHPKGIKNGYFFVEKTALRLARQHDLPVPEVLEIHTAESKNDMDFMLMSVGPGITMDVYLSKDKKSEQELLFQAGAMMGKIHAIPVEGYGFFDNEIAEKDGKLVGLHESNDTFIHTALEENLKRLITYSVSSLEQVRLMQKVLDQHTFEPMNGPKLIHNDFADWNLLTDGKTITSILDWDECYGGDPVADLACWSTFFESSRYLSFLNGYISVNTLPGDYEQRFHYYKLRYAISKMALRAKRFTVDTSDFVKERMEIGKKSLAEELAWFAK